MTTNSHSPSLSASTPESAEDTLRIVANLPAPEGLEERVHDVLRRTPRLARVLPWPSALKPQSNWMRTAAAAAIVFAIAGGGWGVYTRVEPNRPARVLFMPRVAAPGGFSGAGAIRTPETVPGPAAPQPVQSKTAKKAAPKNKITGQPSVQK
ncbi:MAG: hypothetical protein ABSD70_16445 [Terracidiphilus sp.]